MLTVEEILAALKREEQGYCRSDCHTDFSRPPHAAHVVVATESQRGVESEEDLEKAGWQKVTRENSRCVGWRDPNPPHEEMTFEKAVEIQNGRP